MNEKRQLIQCGDHKWAPWSIVCVHLLEGSSRTWRRLTNPDPEVDYDWFCPECLKRVDEDPDDISNLHAVCMHCVRRLRRRFDPNYDPELDANIDLGD